MLVLCTQLAAVVSNLPVGAMCVVKPPSRVDTDSELYSLCLLRYCEC